MIRDWIYYALALTAGGALVSWLPGPGPALHERSPGAGSGEQGCGLREGVMRAEESIDSGGAWGKLDRLREIVRL
jgi:hypothetical protein